MSKARILICHAQIPFNQGGAEILVEELRSNLIERDYNAEVIQLPFKWYPNDEIINNVLAWRLLDITEVNGVPVDLVICTKFPTYVVHHPNKVLWLIHQYRGAYDLLGTQYSDFSHLPVKERDRIVGQIRNFDNNTIPECKSIFAISANVADRLKQFNDLEATVLYPPLRNRIPFGNESYGDYIFVVGRLDPLKRYDVMIRAMQYTKTPVQFVIAGSGKQETELRKMAKDIGVVSKVRFEGHVSNEKLRSLYANCLAVYFAPFDEDYGFVTIEAMKSRKPVLTLSDSGGVTEFVKDGQTGFVFDSSHGEIDFAAIADRVDQLYNNRELAEELGAACIDAVRDINWDTVIKSLVEDNLKN